MKYLILCLMLFCNNLFANLEFKSIDTKEFYKLNKNSLEIDFLAKEKVPYFESIITFQNIVEDMYSIVNVEGNCEDNICKFNNVIYKNNITKNETKIENINLHYKNNIIETIELKNFENSDMFIGEAKVTKLNEFEDFISYSKTGKNELKKFNSTILIKNQKYKKNDNKIGLLLTSVSNKNINTAKENLNNLLKETNNSFIIEYKYNKEKKVNYVLYKLDYENLINFTFAFHIKNLVYNEKEKGNFINNISFLGNGIDVFVDKTNLVNLMKTKEEFNPLFVELKNKRADTSFMRKMKNINKYPHKELLDLYNEYILPFNLYEKNDLAFSMESKNDLNILTFISILQLLQANTFNVLKNYPELKIIHNYAVDK